jgi:hypothetical protein
MTPGFDAILDVIGATMPWQCFLLAGEMLPVRQGQMVGPAGALVRWRSVGASPPSPQWRRGPDAQEDHRGGQGRPLTSVRADQQREAGDQRGARTVSTQASTMLPATPSGPRSAAGSRRSHHTAPATTWVVLTGRLCRVAISITLAATPSVVNPWRAPS